MVLDLASLVSWNCRLTQTDCRVRPRVSSCCLFTLVYLTEELVDPGNSRSFAPALFHLTQSASSFSCCVKFPGVPFLPPFRDLSSTENCVSP